MVVDDSRPRVGDDHLARVEALIAAGRRGKAIKTFMTEGVRVPAVFAAVMPLLPVWPKLKAVADTVVYDTRIVAEHGLTDPTRTGAYAPVIWHTSTVTSSPVDVKTLRSDARRNRERLVASARELFAEGGLDVSVEEITQHAGLGMGTLYRHFPTKEELIDAVLGDAFAELVQLAERAAAAEDAWTGFTGFLEQTLALHATNRGLKDVLSSREHGCKRAQAMRARMRPLLGQMVERAQEQGALRSDFAAEDLSLVFWTAGGVIETTAAVAPHYWRRYLGLLLDGLRAEAATPLPEPALTKAQLAHAARRRQP